MSYASDALIDALERDVDRLERENGQLKYENAKLREEVEQWHRLTAGIELPEYPITEFKPKDLERENAKLRELLLHMYTCMGNVDADGNHECFLCEYEGAECDFAVRMRGLGIEASE